MCYTSFMDIEKILEIIIPTLKKEGVLKASLFGSVARGEATQDSDIDLLVELPKDKSLFDLVGLELDLQEQLHTKVDVLTYKSIHPRIRDNVLADEKVIYEQE